MSPVHRHVSVCDSELTQIAPSRMEPAISHRRRGKRLCAKARVKGHAVTHICSWEGLTSHIPGRQHGKSICKKSEDAPCHQRRRSGQREGDKFVPHPKLRVWSALRQRLEQKQVLCSLQVWVFLAQSLKWVQTHHRNGFGMDHCVLLLFWQLSPRWNGKLSFFVK